MEPAVPLQTVGQRFACTGCPVSEIVAGIPCCSMLYLFKQLGVFLLVGVPGYRGKLQCRAYHCGVGGGLDLSGPQSLKFLLRKPMVLFPLAAMVSKQRHGLSRRGCVATCWSLPLLAVVHGGSTLLEKLFFAYLGRSGGSIYGESCSRAKYSTVWH